MQRFISDMAASDAFRLGLAAGGVGLLLAVVAKLVAPGRRPVPIGGLIFAAAAIGVLWDQFTLPVWVPVGAALMALGAVVPGGWALRAVTVAPGAAMVILLGDMPEGTPLALAAVAVAVCAAAVVDFDEAYRDSALGLPLLGLAVVGVIFTVPDTERAGALLGVAFPLAFAGWPLRLLSLGPGAAAAVASLGWVSALAASSRTGAMIGGLASLGIMLADPVGRRLAKRRPTALEVLSRSPGTGAVVIGLIQVALVFGASRVAGMQRGLVPALAIAVAVLVVGAVVAAAPAGRADTGSAPLSSPE